MARFYVNENFPKQIADQLAGLYCHDVLTTVAGGNANRALPDEVLAFAVSQNRILFSHNRRHFVRLHREVPNHADIIVCTFDPDFGGQARRIHGAVEKETNMACRLTA